MWGALGVGLGPILKGSSALLRPLKYKPQPIVLPTGHAPLPATSPATIDTLIDGLDPAGWVATSVEQRVKLLDQVVWNLVKASKELASLAVQAKGSSGQGIGEEQLVIFPIILGIKEYQLSLKAGGHRKPLGTVKPWPGTNQLAAQVFPAGMMGALMAGYKGYVLCEPGKPATQGQLYVDKKAGKPSPGGVSLVLGAGNQIPVVMLDLLHKLIMEDEVVIAKMSPVNEYVGPILEAALKPLIAAKAVAIVYGGREVGEYLVAHPKVTSVHLTGSADTCNAIVWGSPDAPRTGTPKLTKCITAELGNVTPFIIVPGPWSPNDLREQARNVVSGLVNNASHNCIAAEVLVTAADWPLRGAFLTAVKEELARAPRRVPYYPGSVGKYAAFRQQCAAKGIPVEEFGTPPPSPATPASPGAEPYAGGPQPWLLAEGLSPDQVAGRNENWCGVLQEVALPGTGEDAGAFMAAATEFANTKLWGSLGAGVWAHPVTQKKYDAAFYRMIADLRYGSVTVNVPPAMGFAITALPWGGAPGNTLSDVESGIGFVHNTWMFDHPAKGVLLVPWKSPITPLHYPDNYAVPHMMGPLMRLLATMDNPLVAMPSMLVLTAMAVRG